MLSFPYVKKYQIGERVEFPVAEELLANYNDFHASNLEFYQGRTKSMLVENESIAAVDSDEDGAQLEKRVQADVQAFEDAWGSLDFASATLVGLHIDWDQIQEKMLQEQAKHVRPADSALMPVARQLRKVASILAFSERIITRLHGKAVPKEMIKLMVNGFEMLLQQVKTKDINIPELDGAENKKITKLRTVDGIIDYANQLFALGR